MAVQSPEYTRRSDLVVIIVAVGGPTAIANVIANGAVPPGLSTVRRSLSRYQRLLAALAVVSDYARVTGNSEVIHLDEKRPTRAIEELHQVAATRTERRQPVKLD